MTKPVRDYFIRRMEDPAYAAAYKELEAEYQAERARIRDRIQRSSLWEALEEVEEYFNTRPDLVRLLDWLQQMQRQREWLSYTLPAGQPSYADAGFQVSSEAGYDANDAKIITTEASY